MIIAKKEKTKHLENIKQNITKVYAHLIKENLFYFILCTGDLTKPGKSAGGNIGNVKRS